MKNKLIKLICIVLAAMCLVTMVSCEKGDDKTNDQANTGENNTNEGGDTDSGDGDDAKKEEIDYTVDFITYNIAFYDANDGQMKVHYEGQTISDYTIAKRQMRLKSLVDYYKPDVLALQEVNHIWWPYLITNEDSLLNKTGYQYTGNKSAFGQSDGKGTIDNELYNLLFWNPEKFDLVQEGHFYLTHNGRRSGKNNADQERMCTYAILRNKDTGNETLYASTHLCTTGSESNGELNLNQAKYLVKHLNDKCGGRPIVVGGDYNMHANSDTAGATYRYLTGEGGLNDGRVKAKMKLNGTMASYRSWGSNQNSYTTSGNPIDYVFYKGNIIFAKWQILPDTFKADNTIHPGTAVGGDLYDLSDHLGIFVRVQEKAK